MSRPVYDFRACNDALHAIMNGTLTVKGVSNATLAASGWIWDGPIGGLKKSFPRHLITAITYKGCVELCGNITQMNPPKTVLNIIATWVFPLSILFSLPFESSSGNGSQGIFSVVSAWLGSPQTSLTAIVFNSDQTRLCHQRSKARDRIWADAYYALSCFNQFELPTGNKNDKVVCEDFMKALVYGLFRPLKDDQTDSEENIDIEYTRQLLKALANQLRSLRRRGVVPMLLSLLAFLTTFIFSVVLAFSDVNGDLDVTPLTIGLLYSWLPLLVIYSIMDRNPVSSERTADLMSRWLYNVNAVREWRNARRPTDMPEPAWWENTGDLPKKFRVGEFIGQGRRMIHCGLVHAVACTMPEPDRVEDTPLSGSIGDTGPLAQYDVKAYAVVNRLKGRRPGLWWSAAVCAECLVCTQIMMAVLVAITSPTVGIGCWSGSFITYGVLTSVSWAFNLFQRAPGPWGRFFCHMANILALVFLVFITGLIVCFISVLSAIHLLLSLVGSVLTFLRFSFPSSLLLQLSGALNNCICNISWPAHSPKGGYMIFEDFDFIRDNFNVVFPWVLACVVGFLVVVIVLFRSLFWWLTCKPLWDEPLIVPRETERERKAQVKASTDWLQ